MRYKIIVLGVLPIATKVVMDLRTRADVDLVGVVVGDGRPENYDPWPNVPLLADYVKSEGLPVLTLEELDKFEPNSLDLGLSCRYGRIIRKNAILAFRNGMVNFHGGLLPEVGGLYSCCHSILLGHRTGGGTLHFIDEGVDTGDIVQRAEFEIESNDTSHSVFQKTQSKLFSAYLKHIDSLLTGSVKRTPQEELIRQGTTKAYFNKKSLDGKKLVPINAEFDDMYRIVRAFDFPGKEPAYMMEGDRKIYLTTRSCW